MGNVPFRSPGEAVLVLPPAGAAAASTARSSRTRLLVAPSRWAPSRVLKIQSLEGARALQRAFHRVKVSPGLFLPAAPSSAFINEYHSSDHLGTGPDCGAALERAMKQQNPKERSRRTGDFTLLL